MMYEKLVEEFARRTRVNLESLRSLQRSEPGVPLYEITQLINSMLGLLVFPQQRFINKIPEEPLDDLALKGWPIPQVIGDYPQVRNLKQLVAYLRNAISHGNFEFLADGGGEITGIRMWNVRPNGYTNWKAQLSISDIEGITNKFVELLTQKSPPLASNP